MPEFLTSTPAQVVIWSTVLVVLLIAGFYIVQRFRNPADDAGLSANELLTSFRQMHEGGQLNAAEFRNIKTVLKPKLQDEIGGANDS